MALVGYALVALCFWDQGKEAEKGESGRAQKMPSVCLGPHAAQSSSLCPDTCAGSTGHTDRVKDA